MPFWQTNNYLGFKKITISLKKCKVLILMNLSVSSFGEFFARRWLKFVIL
jgi:hypothetical protein